MSEDSPVPTPPKPRPRTDVEKVLTRLTENDRKPPPHGDDA